MAEFSEKRRFRRFEMPRGEARHKRIAGPSILRHFSKSHPVLNMSIGGIALLCKEDFHQGDEVTIQLAAPNEKPLNLRSIVRWQGPIALSADVIVGFKFIEFGNSKNLNPPNALNVLRRLYARYSKG